MTIFVFPDKESLSKGAAERFVSSAREAIARSGQFTVALSGGHTPARGFQLLAEEPYVGQIDWSRVHIFWGDDRNVPGDDKDSNERMARDAFLNSVPIPAAQIFPMYNGENNVEAAASYQRLLQGYFPPEGPTFDLVLLGVGPDGHTASLFPDDHNEDSSDWVIPAFTDVFSVRDRITLTYKAISLASAVVFEIEGEDKATVLKEIIEDFADYPAGVVAHNSKDVTWLLDSAAASQLSSANFTLVK
ncbi:MAG TPA: 6-phosphogluconolactonase [Fimbriimonadaceae bacterium]